MNGEVAGDISLRNLWTWLDAAKSLATTGNFKLPGGVPYRYQGVWWVLHFKQDCVLSIVMLILLMPVETDCNANIITIDIKWLSGALVSTDYDYVSAGFDPGRGQLVHSLPSCSSSGWSIGFVSKWVTRETWGNLDVTVALCPKVTDRFPPDSKGDVTENECPQLCAATTYQTEMQNC